jgi:hypothetical protein
MSDLTPKSIERETPVRSNVTGRSKRRLNRIRHRPDTPDSSDSDNDEMPDDNAGESKRDEGEVSGTVAIMSPEKRLEAIEHRLKEVVQVFKEGVEDLSIGDHSNDEGEREVWGMLDFALQGWKYEN